MLARILALWLALFPALAFAQSAVLNGFPPGTFQSRAAIDAPSSGAPTVTPLLAFSYSVTGPSISAANFAPLYPASWGATSTARAITPIPIAGTLSNLSVVFQSGAGAAGTYTVALVQNGTNSATFQCNVPNSGTTCTSSNSVAIAAGDKLGWQVCPGTMSGTSTCTTSGTETSNTSVEISAVFTSTNNNETFVLSAGQTSGASNSVANYMSFGSAATYATTDAVASAVMPTAGQIDDLFVTSSAAIAAGEYFFNVFQNGTVAASLQCHMSASAAACNSASAGTNTAITVAQGDTISVEICPAASYSGSCVPSGTPTSAIFHSGVRLRPTVAGQSVLVNVTPGAFGLTTATQYYAANAGLFRSSTESVVVNVAPSITGNFTIKNLTVNQQPQPGTGVTRSYTLRVPSGTSSSLACTVAAGTGATGTCQDNTDSATGIAAGTSVNFQTSVSGTNTATTTAKYSAVMTVP